MFNYRNGSITKLVGRPEGEALGIITRSQIGLINCPCVFLWMISGTSSSDENASYTGTIRDERAQRRPIKGRGELATQSPPTKC